MTSRISPVRSSLRIAAAASLSGPSSPPYSPKSSTKGRGKRASSTKSNRSDDSEGEGVYVSPTLSHELARPSTSPSSSSLTSDTSTHVPSSTESCFAPRSFPNKEATPTRLRASLFRSFVLADYVTMANAVCGICSIFLCLNYLDNNRHWDYIVGAFAFLPLALFFDMADGWVARKRKSHSPWGSDLDSLADVVSFVAAPAVLGFTLGLRGMWDSILLSFFVFCGIARLARYNVTSSQLAIGSKVSYYEGFPVPTSLIIVAAWALAFYYNVVFDRVIGGNYKILNRDFHPISLVYFAWGCLFVSASVRIPKP